jgi:hypothetical protein
LPGIVIAAVEMWGKDLVVSELQLGLPIKEQDSGVAMASVTPSIVLVALLSRVGDGVELAMFAWFVAILRKNGPEDHDLFHGTTRY